MAEIQVLTEQETPPSTPYRPKVCKTLFNDEASALKSPEDDKENELSPGLVSSPSVERVEKSLSKIHIRLIPSSS